MDERAPGNGKGHGEVKKTARTKRPRRTSPTALDVAKAAGVAPATAARVLGNYGSTSAHARERVIEAAASLGYRPNRLARSMATGLTQTIGVVIANIEDEFFSRMVRGITDVARAAGSEVVLMNSGEDEDEERHAVRTLMERQVDGLIIAPASIRAPDHLLEVRDSRKPLVLVDRNLAGVNADAVVIDGYRAAQSATEYLIGLGHRRIAIVTDVPEGVEAASSSGPGAADTAGVRLAGFLGAMERAGIEVGEPSVARSAASIDGARRETHALLERWPPSAIFATDNSMTMGALQALQEERVEIPAQISLFGFDDLEWTKVTHPPLSVVSQPIHDLGATAARCLLLRIDGSEDQVRTHILPTTLIHRGSVTRPPDPEAV